MEDCRGREGQSWKVSWRKDAWPTGQEEEWEQVVGVGLRAVGVVAKAGGNFVRLRTGVRSPEGWSGLAPSWGNLRSRCSCAFRCVSLSPLFTGTRRLYVRKDTRGVEAVTCQAP